MNDTQKELQPLLENFRLIILPAEIDDTTFAQLTGALKLGRELHPGKRLQLLCRGEGGGTSVSLALVDLIQADGKIDGMLIGGAFSAHSYIWAGCSRRFCYPRSGIGVHGTILSSNTWEDSVYRKTEVDRMEIFDREIAKIYAKASNKSKDWWLNQMRDGHSACRWIGAKKLIKLDMARYYR